MGLIVRIAVLIACLGLSQAQARSALVEEGYAALELGDYERAVVLAERATQAARTDTDRYEALSLRADIAFDFGPMQAATALAAEADAEARALFGEIHEERLYTLERLAILASDGGAPREAVRTFAEMIRMGSALGLPPDALASETLNMAGVLIEAGDAAAASVLASDVLSMTRDSGAIFSEVHVTASLMRAEAQLHLGRPVEGLAGLLEVLERGLADYIAAWPEIEPHASEVLAAFDAVAAERGDLGTITDRWLAQAAEVRAARAPFPYDAVAQDVIMPLQAGDLAAASAGAAQHLDGRPSDDPEAAYIFEALVGAHLSAGDPQGAAPWLARLARYPAGFLASRMSEPWFTARPVFEWLSGEGRYGEALSIAARMIETGALAYGDAEDGVIDMRLVQADTLAALGQPQEAAAEVEAVLAALDAAAQDKPYFRAWAQIELSKQAQEAGKTTQALDLMYAARATFEGAGLDKDPLFFGILGTAAQLELLLERPDRAAALAQEHVENLAHYYGASSREAILARFTLLTALQSAGQDGAAQDVLRLLRSDLGPDPDTSRDLADPLVRTLLVAELRQAREHGTDTDLSALLANYISGDDATRAQDGLELSFLSAFAILSYDMGRGDVAQALVERAEAMVSDPGDLAAPLQVIRARLAADRGDLGTALALFRATTAETLALEGTPDHLPYYLEALQRQMNVAPANRTAALMAEAFLLTQRINTTAAGEALQQATSRWQVGPDLGAILRRMQDGQAAAADLREALGAVPAAGAAPAAGAGPGTGIHSADLRARLLSQVAEIEDLESRLAGQFPAYSAFGTAEPVALSDVQRLLAADEALIVFASTNLTTAEGEGVSQVTVVTREGAAMVGLPDSDALNGMAQHLRCAAALTDPRCAGMTGAGTRGGFVLDPVAGDEPSAGFDFEAAHMVHDTLLAPLEDALAGKTHLMFVPDAALMPMPFHLMLTRAPTAETSFRTAPWLIRDVAISVFPSVASFKALRDTAAAESRAPAFLGVGDPLIGRQANGPVPHACGVGEEVLAAALPPSDGITTRDALGAGALLRLSALPDTRCELAEIAEAFGSDYMLLLQENANESTLKALSASGELERYSVISFATHGLIAGEIGTHDAGLVLTPPAPARPAPASGATSDDGLLTTSEIAALRLDADFVILSACNTASGRTDNDEGLSGLASAFFYAGARSLLISHWPVYSDAAVALTTRLFAVTQDTPGLGRAEAMRRAILAQIDDPSADARQLHPAYWAPFMLVGASS